MLLGGFSGFCRSATVIFLKQYRRVLVRISQGRVSANIFSKQCLKIDHRSFCRRAVKRFTFVSTTFPQVPKNSRKPCSFVSWFRLPAKTVQFPSSCPPSR